MSALDAAAHEFLAQPRIAVVGISANRELTGNGIYRALKAGGTQVFAVSSSAEVFEGDTCYPKVSAIPDSVEGVIIVTRPEITAKVVRDCAEAGVKRIWMHNNTLGPSSVSDDAVAYCQDNGISVIAGACPMMYIDPMHKFMKVVLGAMGRLPQPG
jgi:hypothetical protein